jgi:hypothetical protein
MGAKPKFNRICENTPYGHIMPRFGCVRKIWAEPNQCYHSLLERNNSFFLFKKAFVQSITANNGSGFADHE